MYIYPHAHAGILALIVATSTQGGITWASNCTATTLAIHKNGMDLTSGIFSVVA